MVSGRGGLEVEHWSDNRTLSALAVRISLGTQIYLVANAPAIYSQNIPINLGRFIIIKNNYTQG